MRVIRDARDGDGAFQELNQAAIAGPLTKLALRPRKASDLGHMIARAMREARSGRPAPVQMALPFDLLNAPATGDVEGRSALLLGKAKDNNASCAIGPFIRLFDTGFTLQNVETCEVRLEIEGLEGFQLRGASHMSEISRRPADLVAQTIGPNHQYPDGLMLLLGTMFAPVQDRRAPGQGFTHEMGDRVSISTPALGTLTNWVTRSDRAKPWTFGISALMSNLARRGVL